MIDVELVWILCQFIHFLVLLLRISNCLSRDSLIMLLLLEVIGVIAWIALQSLQGPIIMLILLFYSVGFIIFLLKILISMVNLLFFHLFMLAATIIKIIDLRTDFFIILLRPLYFFFLFGLFCGISKPF
jgi:hypothetical protein